MSGHAPKPCEEVREELTEFALGILSGERRSTVLNHVESCPQCNAELEQLSMVSDTILQLASEVEPPLGFELRLAQKLRESPGMRRPSRFRRVGVLAAAAVLTAVLGFSLGALATTGNHNDQGGATLAKLTSASLTSRGHVLGEVFVAGGNPAWMFMMIDSGTWSGAVTCEVTLAGGRVETIGRFKLSGGYGAWGAPLTSAVDEIRSAQIVTANGRLLASAHLPA